MCGALLHGDVGCSGGVSNKVAGLPMNRDGKLLVREDGSPNVDAQPPFLLRYSPALFAAEMPAVFAHDPDTNRLCLKPGMPRPWVRPGRGGGRGGSSQGDAAKTQQWLFCLECKSRFQPSGGRVHSHVPFRDRASQAWMKPARRNYVPTYGRAAPAGPGAEGALAEAARSPEQDEPEEPEASQDWALEELGREPLLEPGDPEVEDFGFDPPPFGQAVAPPIEEHDDDVEADQEAVAALPPELPEEFEVRPSLSEYEERWTSLLARNSREVEGEFGPENLVPKPIHQLWQDCPYVPFDKLKSDEAQARLAVVKPKSGLEPASAHDAVPRYPHNTGAYSWV
jgi:hypothetical protein